MKTKKTKKQNRTCLNCYFCKNSNLGFFYCGHNPTIPKNAKFATSGWQLEAIRINRRTGVEIAEDCPRYEMMKEYKREYLCSECGHFRLLPLRAQCLYPVTFDSTPAISIEIKNHYLTIDEMKKYPSICPRFYKSMGGAEKRKEVAKYFETKSREVDQ